MKTFLQDLINRVSLRTIRRVNLETALIAHACNYHLRINHDLSPFQAACLCDQLEAAVRNIEAARQNTVREFTELERAEQQLERWLPYAVVGVCHHLFAIRRLRKQRLTLMNAIRPPEPKPPQAHKEVAA